MWEEWITIEAIGNVEKYGNLLLLFIIKCRHLSRFSRP